MLTKKYSNSEAKCRVTFTLPKEAISGAKQVNLIGDFNEWNPSLAIPMKKQKDQYKITLELPTGRDYQFRYIGDNGVWENDWAADQYIASPVDDVDNSVVSLQDLIVVSKNGKSNTAANSISDTKLQSNGTRKTLTISNKVKRTATDDLTKIEGIGPKISEILNAAGINSFESLAASNETELRVILENAGNRYKMHNPASWGMQAKIAAKGDWDQLKKLQDELNGGKLK